MKNSTPKTWVAARRRALIYLAIACCCAFLAGVYLFKAPFNPPMLLGVMLILGAGFCFAFNEGWNAWEAAQKREDEACQ